MPQGLGISCKAYLLYNILVLPSCNSDSWRRYTLKFLCWCVVGKVGELVKPSGAGEDCLEVCVMGLVVGGNYVGCLFIVVIFMGFGVAKRSVTAMLATRKDNYYGKEGFSLCNTAVLKLYCKSDWVV